MGRVAAVDKDETFEATGRRAFLGKICTGLVLTLPSGRGIGQQAKKFRIGVLLPGPTSPFKEIFLSGLRELGYAEGKNFTLEYRNVPAQDLQTAARELVELNVDLLWVAASSGVRAALNATKAIPIVAVDLESDPVASGFVSNLARPGGNLTGFFLDLPEFGAKRLEVLKEALPSLSGATLLWDPTLDRTPLSKMNAAARDLKMRLVVREIHSPEDLGSTFETASATSHAVVMMQSPTLDSYGFRIVKLGEKHKVPVMAVFAFFVQEGALLSYGPNAIDMTAQSARYVDRILKGAIPGNLPIQRPVKFDLAVNTKTAKMLGVTLGPSVMQRADQVVR